MFLDRFNCIREHDVDSIFLVHASNSSFAIIGAVGGPGEHHTTANFGPTLVRSPDHFCRKCGPCQLPEYEPRVESAAGQKAVVGPAFRNTTIFQHNNIIRIADRG
jgi:hypothetical protein